IRQYAREKLLDSGEAERVRRRHLHYFLRMAEAVEPELRGPEQVRWFGRLAADHDNLRVALDWGQAAGEAEACLRMAGALGQFWFNRGHWREERDRLEAALAVGTPNGGARRSLARAKALNEAGR